MPKTMDTNEKKENRQMPAGGGEIVPFAEDSVTKINAANVSQEQIQARIFSIRGEQVMLDRDLAMFYGVETKRINERVKRNTTRFPEDFCFQLTKEEWESLRSQNATLENGRGQHTKYLPYAFTEPGVGQLSSVLKSKTADDVSVRIQRAFVAMRRFISANAGLFQRIDTIERHLIATDNKVEMALQRMDEIAPVPSPQTIFATGCVWDAHTYMSELIRSAKVRIILIDNYCDERTLMLLVKRQPDVECTIYTRFNDAFDADLEKHNRQYPAIRKVQLPRKEHDRFLMIDDTVYILGDSLKNLGHSLTTVLKTSFSVEEILENCFVNTSGKS